MILVVGASGTNGREIVDRLAASGASVRALVRNVEHADRLRKPGVEIARGDLDDPASLDLALKGVKRAFFLAAVDQRYVGWFQNFLEAAKRSGVSHVVKFSGLGAAIDSPSEIMRQHGETDEALAASGLPYTILRPNAFYQNMLWAASTIKDQGAFYLPVGNARQSLVDVRDVAGSAVEVLTGTGHEGKIYEITGPDSLTYHELAARFSSALGKPVRYVDVPSEAALDSMLKSGMPEWNARALTELYRVFAADAAARTTDSVQVLTGRPPIPFEQFARDHLAAFT